MKKLVYFAHPVTHYGKKIEEQCIEAIENYNSHVDIFNPNQEWMQRVYQKRKKEEHENPFGLFTEIVDVCDMTIGVTFYDGIMGAGVFNECLKAHYAGKEVLVLNPSAMTFVSFTPTWKKLSIEETRERIKDKVM